MEEGDEAVENVCDTFASPRLAVFFRLLSSGYFVAIFVFNISTV